MKFAHMADIHIGGWRDPVMNDLPSLAFERATDICISNNVDFVLISGDLFNTAIPGIDSIKSAVRQLQKLKDKKIQVYVIPGSHDYSPSGKTMLDVLEEAELFVNVVKGSAEEGILRLRFTTNVTSGVKITGILGKRSGLEKAYYEALDTKALEEEEGRKIFMFHSGINEIVPESVSYGESLPLSFFPKGFDYYAGGHIHAVKKKRVSEYGLFVYPGPLFPNNIRELEVLKNGGLMIFDDEREDKAGFIPIMLHPVVSIIIDCNNLIPEEISSKLLEKARPLEMSDSIVIIRLEGKMRDGKTTDIDYSAVINLINEKRCFKIIKNVSRLESPLFEQINVKRGTMEEVEDEVINEHIGQSRLKGIDKETIKGILNALNSEKMEGETNATFRDRMISDLEEIFRNN